MATADIQDVFNILYFGILGCIFMLVLEIKMTYLIWYNVISNSFYLLIYCYACTDYLQHEVKEYTFL